MKIAPLYLYRTGKGKLILSSELPDIDKDGNLKVLDNQSLTLFSSNIDFVAASLMAGFHILTKNMSEDEEMQLVSDLGKALDTGAVIVGTQDFRVDRLTISDIKSLKSN